MNDDSLIQDVEDAIRKEKLETFWHENGGYIIAFAVLVVLGTAAITGWRSWEERTNKFQTEMLISALESPTPATALEEVQFNLDGGHLALAKFNEARLLKDAGNFEGAADAYRIVARSNADSVLRDMATYLSVMTAWEDLDAAERTPAATNTMLETLAPLISDNKNAWQHHARKMAAIIIAETTADYESARAYLAPSMRAEGVTPNLMRKMLALDHVFTLKQKAALETQENITKEQPQG